MTLKPKESFLERLRGEKECILLTIVSVTKEIVGMEQGKAGLEEQLKESAEELDELNEQIEWLEKLGD